MIMTIYICQNDSWQKMIFHQMRNPDGNL